MANAARFYDRLMEQLTLFEHGRYRATEGTSDTYIRFRRMLVDPDTKRLLFDARQAAIFDDIDAEKVLGDRGKVRMPFDQFYVEFTDPVLLRGQEPGQRDLARAFLYVGSRAPSSFMVGDITNPVTGEVVRAPFGTLTLFLTGGSEDRMTSFVNLAAGRIEVLRREPDPSEVPIDWNDDAMHLLGLPIQQLPDRHIGWWESYGVEMSSLFTWMMVYVMAKSVRVVPEPLSRQAKRALARKNLPNPWHVVRVEPKFYAPRGEEQHEPLWSHSYRYDVIGHLRFGRHPRSDGSYSETIEWIAPHQRGLANETYIPKTYKVERGKVVSDRMQEYFKP